VEKIKNLRAGILIVVCAACASAPLGQMDATLATLQEARQADAQRYASPILREAERYLTEAKAKMDAGHYDNAQHLLLLARDQAQEAIDVAQSLKAAEGALAQSQARGATMPEAEEAIQYAKYASSMGDGQSAVAWARRASEIIRYTENQQWLKQAQEHLARCPSKRPLSAAAQQLVNEARSALASEQGGLARRLAEQACPHSP
jgi:tetratricopeptide (TPR) repeat protein